MPSSSIYPLFIYPDVHSLESYHAYPSHRTHRGNRSLLLSICSVGCILPSGLQISTSHRDTSELGTTSSSVSLERQHLPTPDHPSIARAPPTPCSCALVEVDLPRPHALAAHYHLIRPVSSAYLPPSTLSPFFLDHSLASPAQIILIAPQRARALREFVAVHSARCHVTRYLSAHAYIRCAPWVFIVNAPPIVNESYASIFLNACIKHTIL